MIDKLIKKYSTRKKIQGLMIGFEKCRQELQEIEERINENIDDLRYRMELIEKNVQNHKMWNEQMFHEYYERMEADYGQMRANRLWAEQMFHEYYERMEADYGQMKLNRLWTEQMFHEYYGLIESNKMSLSSLLRNEILEYYEDKILDKEKSEVIDWIKCNSLRMYPYKFCEEYLIKKVDVLEDSEGWKYVEYKDRPVYFPENFSNERIKGYYTFLIMEQDARSPHCYFDGKTTVLSESVLIDAGAAEGLIALSIIDQVSKVILVECDPIWLEPLKRTFAPYKDKVEIISKKIGNIDSEDCITLKTIINSIIPIRPVIIKADIEGAEVEMLSCLDKIFLKNGSIFVICTYHNQFDEIEIKEIFDHNGYKCWYSNGYVIPILGNEEKPYLRRALIHAVVENKREH